MMRYAYISLIFFVMVMAILLSSCAPTPVIPAAATATPAPTLPTVPQPEKTVVEQAAPTAIPTSAPIQVIPVTAPTQAPAAMIAEVTAGGLNVRVGPGMNHHIMGKLAAGDQVVVEGRSLNGEWVAVRLADGREGWVYSSFLRSNVNLAALPVMEAYGGPVTTQPESKPTAKPSGRYTLNVLISANQAEVEMAGFAAERDITLRLSAPDENLAMTVATATTDAQGRANLTFDMPGSWPDGSSVTQTQMELQVLGSDGKLLGRAKLSISYE